MGARRNGMPPEESVILVTGAHGSLASRVLGLLTADTAGRVIAVSRRPQAGGIDWVTGDLRDAATWAGLPKGITHVFHLAAAIPWLREQKTHASVVTDNLGPLAHLLEHSQHWPSLTQIVYASSVSVYGWTREVLGEDAPKRPVDLYGASKLAGEDLLQAATARGIRVASLRYSSLYGQGQYPGTVMPTMIAAAMQMGRIRIYGEGLRSQDFLHYDDAAQAALLAYRHATAGSFNVGNGTPVTMTKLAELIRDVFTQGRAEIVHDRQMPEGDPGFRIDISKAVRELSFRPRRDLRQGLMQLKRETFSEGSDVRT
jgi:nucleoside-diphosphate-sugar epimerase